MKIDIVMPKNNEAELLELAEKLGFKELIFVYNDLKKKPINFKSENFKSRKIKILSGVLIKNANEADKAKQNFDFVFGKAQRSFFENKKIKYLVNAESDAGKDFLYQKRAGLDDVMCRLAKEKNKIIVFNIGLLSGNVNAGNNIYSRMMQNAKLCRKHKIKTMIATLARTPLDMRAPKDLDGFARILKLL